MTFLVVDWNHAYGILPPPDLRISEGRIVCCVRYMRGSAGESRASDR